LKWLESEKKVSNQKILFGDFILGKRKQQKMTIRELAKKLEISPGYLCDIEKHRKSAVADDILDKLIFVLNLSEEETEQMYDLAAIARNTVSADLPKYIMESPIIRTALREAKKNQIPDEKWKQFISEITIIILCIMNLQIIN
jgi:transcriptional regulator with XRE-family HTH domain